VASLDLTWKTVYCRWPGESSCRLNARRATKLKLVCRSRFILNDTYRTDLSILYSPYIIALAALYLSFSLEDKSPRDPFRVRGQTVSSLDRTSLTINEISRGEDRSAMDRLIIRAKAAGYFADFAISIPTMLTIVQEIISVVGRTRGQKHVFSRQSRSK
jgi:hypothetical protein